MIRNEVKEQMMKKEKRKMNKRETKDGEGDSIIIIIIAIIHTRFLLESFWCFLAFIQLERKKGHEKVKKKEETEKKE